MSVVGNDAVDAARAAAAKAVEMLAASERLRARAVAALVDFDVLDAHVVEGYATPQRHLIHRGGVADGEAARLHRIIRFCAEHPMVADALEAGDLTVDHADVLRAASHVVGGERLDEDLLDLLAAARDVELCVFRDRVEVWQWRRRPEQTADEVADRFDRRSLTMQSDVFGGARGQFTLDAAGAALVAEALSTPPDPVLSLHPPRSQRQRMADRFVEIADHALNGTLPGDVGDADGDDADGNDSGFCEPSGARHGGGSVDVVIDLPTLLGLDFDLDDHRGPDGRVDWDSIQQSLARHRQVPRPVVEQFLCDASWRQLITKGRRVVLDYNQATPDIAPALRRVIQRRDRHCQFDGCDRPWTWCDVHHLIPKAAGGPTSEPNLALVCRFHHTLIHQVGWHLRRTDDGRLLTTSP